MGRRVRARLRRSGALDGARGGDRPYRGAGSEARRVAGAAEVHGAGPASSGRAPRPRATPSGSPRTALVTGATAGLGYHIAVELARAGYRVVVTGRNEARGESVADEIGRSAGTCRVHFVAADASTVGMNQALARLVCAEFGRLDVLINNVDGGPNARRSETEDGYEATLAVGFVAGVALTSALLPLLRASAPARVVNIVSGASSLWDGDPFDDIQSADRYVAREVYARAKLLMLLWTIAFSREQEGTGVLVNAIDPWSAGKPASSTLATATLPRRLLAWPTLRGLRRRARPERAARAAVRLAAAAAVDGVNGMYFEGLVAHDPPARLRNPVLVQRVCELGNSLVAGAPTALA